jgi:integrase
VFSEKEVAQLPDLVHGMPGLMLRLCYGSGLRVSECVRLRVKDLDFEQGLLYVRRGKGDKDLTTLLPGCIRPLLKDHLERVKEIHGRELAAGRGDVELPDRLAVKYPRATWEWAWQYLLIYTHVLRTLYPPP